MKIFNTIKNPKTRSYFKIILIIIVLMTVLTIIPILITKLILIISLRIKQFLPQFSKILNFLILISSLLSNKSYHSNSNKCYYNNHNNKFLPNSIWFNNIQIIKHQTQIILPFKIPKLTYLTNSKPQIKLPLFKDVIIVPQVLIMQIMWIFINYLGV